ncbi:MAG TPA: SGNH/GDSL hydrolase family protein [Arachnia sp.]|nr:SGNH/GDSL hydrolase family protein [Arachnia sp.]HMT86033.1 SGNH/GDSL hydrolase family protein [Arachnia sp.]
MRPIARRCVAALAAVGMAIGGLSLAATTDEAAAAGPIDVVLVDEDFAIGESVPAFGFDRDASISGGVLQLNNALANEAVAAKRFGPHIARQSAVEVSFDWTYFGSSNAKGGIEFRDLYGRLVFALQGTTRSTGVHELRYSTTGVDSDSSDARFALEPTWRFVPLTVGTTYRVSLLADFATKTVSYRVTQGGATLVDEVDQPITGTGLARMVSTSAYKTTTNAQTLDNLVIKGRGDAPEPVLEGATIYALGDSIVAGHQYQKGSFPNFLGWQEGATVVKAAVNGATILPSTNHIGSQIAALPTASPDFVLFNGGTNDAYPANLTRLGEVSQGFDGPFDVSTFAGSFEDLLAGLQAKYPAADLVYVAVHKLGARDLAAQEALRELELAITEKWGVAVADLYTSGLDTADDDMRVKYSFDSLQASGLPGTAETTGSWGTGASTRPTGTHPNFPAIEEFYLPEVSRVLRSVQELRPARLALSQLVTSVSAPLDEADYTADSWLALTNTLSQARFTAGSSRATEQQLTASEEAVHEAVRGLVRVDAAPVPLEVATTHRCVASRVVMVTSVTNTGSTALSVTTNSAYGSKLIENLQPGTRVSMAFSTRAVSVLAGTVEVTAPAENGGQEQPRVVVPTDAYSC